MKLKKKKEEWSTSKDAATEKLWGEITTPVSCTSAAIRETSKQQIENGEYCLGEITAPKSYQKLTLDYNCTLKKECFTGCDRKIPLVEIRKNL